MADFPLSRSKEEAIHWFEGSPGFSGQNQTNRGLPNTHDTKKSTERKGSRNTHHSEKQPPPKHNPLIDQEEPEETHSSYGTTQVSILTVREVPVMSPDEAQRSLMADPFGGFGSIAPAGMLNPFGTLFGGFFGGMPSDSSMPNRMSGSRSVSSSTRMTRDEHGKRVATTVTKTTVVDGDGKIRTETETTIRHLDEGGRVETKKVVHVDGGDGEDTSSTTTSPNRNGKNDDDAQTIQRGGVRAAHFHSNMPPSPPFFPSPPGAIIDTSAPASPPQVAEIATDLRLGLAVTDSTSTDPDNPNARKSSSGSGGWRRTEYLFRLGRFIPPFMVVSQYYEDKEEEERRRKQLTKEYNEKRQRQKENRWGKSTSSNRQQQEEKSSNRDSDDDNITPETNNFPVPANFPIDISRSEYLLQRLHTQMEKNAAMMGAMLKQMLKPDFPRKVYQSGERIYENLGPTAERTSKLMKDVWTMWVGSWEWGNGDDDRRGGSRRR